MKVNPYLIFNGRCEEAFKFYEQCLGGKIEAVIPYAGTPAEAHMPSEWRDKVMHACLSMDGQSLMGSDGPPEHYKMPQGFSVSLGIENRAKGERVFETLAEGGTVHMPFQKTFWAAGFGMLTDRFGVPWMINCEKE